MGIIMANDDWKRLERNCSELLLQPLLSDKMGRDKRTVNRRTHGLRSFESIDFLNTFQLRILRYIVKNLFVKLSLWLRKKERKDCEL